jgi:hypothetical protein
VVPADLVAGIGSRMVFEFGNSNGLRPDIVSFSIAHHISAAAWPTALVLMAICEGDRAASRPQGDERSGGPHRRCPRRRLIAATTIPPTRQRAGPRLH